MLDDIFDNPVSAYLRGKSTQRKNELRNKTEDTMAKTFPIEIGVYNKLCEDKARLLAALEVCVRALRSSIGKERLADHFPLKLQQAEAAIAKATSREEAS